jgi:SAM-dependent methyltransferase
VHGFDVSPSLVELARERARTEAPSVVFSVVDVATTIPDAPFDRIASRFGVMFFADPAAAFANLARWLAPGGRFAFAVWAAPKENPWVTTVRDVVAEIVELPVVEPDAPGPFRYADVDVLLRLLAGAGFRDVDVRDWRGALPIGGGMSAADAADFAIASFSSFGELLAKRGPDALETALRSLTPILARHVSNGRVELDACVHVVSGARH